MLRKFAMRSALLAISLSCASALRVAGTSALYVRRATPPTMKAPTATARTFLDLTIGDKPVGRMTFALFGEVAPRTVENFRALCTGERGVGVSGQPLHLKGSTFHRIIPQFMCQGGDFTNSDGTGGESIYGRTFDDESFELKHSSIGLLSMANSGPNTNGSQFFVTIAPCPWLDGKHVVFGELVDGYDVLGKLEMVGSRSGTTKFPVVVSDCGELEL